MYGSVSFRALFSSRLMDRAIRIFRDECIHGMVVARMNPETWVDEHGDYLYRYAYSRLRDKSMTEDMVQETFLAAMGAKERFDGRRSERAWLMGILKHKIIDHIRKAVREIPVENTEFYDIENSPVFKAFGIATTNPPKWHFQPRKVLEQKEFWDVFTSCLTKLDGRMHTAFVLRELEGWTTEDICKELDVTANHLWVLLHRARAGLKGCLETNWMKLHNDS